MAWLGLEYVNGGAWMDERVGFFDSVCPGGGQGLCLWWRVWYEE